MKRIVGTITVVTALLAFQQVLAPFAGLAQVDPCEPVRIAPLCPDPSPSPSTSPSPDDEGGKQVEGPVDGPADEAVATGPFLLHGSQDTSKLVRFLSRLQPYGISLRKALLSVVGPFPVAGLSWWANDWHAPRCCPFPHLHQGLDMFARNGTPLVAAADGVVSQKVDRYPSGKGIEITDENGTEYFYAHLSKFQKGLRIGERVEVGDVVGYVGDTGNAKGTIPHVHFEVQPKGTPAPPKPFVDRWLRMSERRALAFVQRTIATRAPLDEFAFRLTRLFDLTAGNGALDETSQQLLLLGGFQPGVTSLEMARRTLGQMAWEIDWSDLADEQLLDLARRYADAASGGMPARSPWVSFAAGLGNTRVAPEGSG